MLEIVWKGNRCLPEPVRGTHRRCSRLPRRRRRSRCRRCRRCHGAHCHCSWKSARRQSL